MTEFVPCAQEMKGPDFYIVGAPKCGTTALHHYLTRHPELSMLPKELHYWGSDLEFQNPRLPRAVYEARLAELHQQKTIGEVAVWYLRSESAAKEIKAYTPEAKIIILLRDPVSAAYSLHSQMHYTGNEPKANFSEALAEEEKRKQRKNLPEHYYCPAQGLCYREVYTYADQLQRYYDAFPPEQLLVLRFEDFKQDTAGVFQQILRFIGVDETFETDFDVINSNQEQRSETLRDLTLKPSSTTKRIVKTLLPSKKIREKIKSRIWDMNSKETERAPIDPAVAASLRTHFQHDLTQVSRITGLDTSEWQAR